MKEFGIPSMTLIQLKKENIMCESKCSPHMCYSHECDCGTSCSSWGGGTCYLVQCDNYGTCTSYCVEAYE